MKNKILTLVMTLLLAAGAASVPVCAAEQPLFTDQSGTVTEEESAELNSMLGEISERQSCDVVICMVSDFGGKEPTEYADDYYDTHAFGYGETEDGILLLINPVTRDWAISTEGAGITTFTDPGEQYIIDQISPALGEDDYYGAFTQFAQLCDDFITQAHTGEPYTSGNMPGEESGEKSIDYLPVDIGAGLAAGIIIALIIVMSNRSALKSVRRQTRARDYMRKGSFGLTYSNEIFAGRHVSRTKRPDDSDTHTSSSGDVHGGASGKF